MWPGGFVVGCHVRWAATASSSWESFFSHDFIFIYWNSRVIHAYQCTNAVDLGFGPSSLFCIEVCDHIVNVFPVHSLI